MEQFACACLTLSLHDHFFSLTEAVMKLQFEPSGNCDHLCMVPTPRHSVAACLPWTSSERPHSEEDEVGIDSHMVSRSGRLLTAPGADAVPGCTCNKGAVWYAPPAGAHAKNMQTATGMHCDGWMDGWMDICAWCRQCCRGCFLQGRTKEKHIVILVDLQ